MKKLVFPFHIANKHEPPYYGDRIVLGTVLEVRRMPPGRKYALDSVKGGWLEGFVSWKRRSGRVKEISIGEYVYRLVAFQKEYNVSLDRSSLLEIQAALDKHRALHHQNGHVMLVGLVKDGLTFLKRQDVNSEIKMPQRIDRTSNVREQIIQEEDLAKL
ncbi:MAG: hypothetical protein ABSF09_14375, partial [Candidatus Bathyarchaeia archaeon]